MKTMREAADRLRKAWPHIVRECRQVLGSELYYQALVYHCLRQHGQVPLGQLGMNVKMWIDDPVSDLFRSRDVEKNEKFQGGYEPIPDICLFSPKVSGDWRRRNAEKTMAALLLAVEVKVSEKKGNRLTAGEVGKDIEKLAAHRAEAKARKSTFMPVMMIIDTAPIEAERMTSRALDKCQESAREHAVGFLYVSLERVIEAPGAEKHAPPDVPTSASSPPRQTRG